MSCGGGLHGIEAGSYTPRAVPPLDQSPPHPSYFRSICAESMRAAVIKDYPLCARSLLRAASGRNLYLPTGVFIPAGQTVMGGPLGLIGTRWGEGGGGGGAL